MTEQATLDRAMSGDARGGTRCSRQRCAATDDDAARRAARSGSGHRTYDDDAEAGMTEQATLDGAMLAAAHVALRTCDAPRRMTMLRATPDERAVPARMTMTRRPA